MRCVFCGFADTRVVDSRPQARVSRVRRRRECERCGKRFSTTEMPGDLSRAPELFSPMVVKKSGAYEPLDRKKLARSIAVSLRKSRRAAVNVSALADEVAEEVTGRETPADTRAIGEMILARLKRLDPMGYLRYASVHREMSSPEDFANLLGELRDAPVDNDNNDDGNDGDGDDNNNGGGDPSSGDQDEHGGH